MPSFLLDLSTPPLFFPPPLLLLFHLFTLLLLFLPLPLPLPPSSPSSPLLSRLLPPTPPPPSYPASPLLPKERSGSKPAICHELSTQTDPMYTPLNLTKGNSPCVL